MEGVHYFAFREAAYRATWVLGMRGPRLPLRPIWTGFVGNTILYATGAWLLGAAIARVRRRARLDHRKCFRCKYDLRAAVPPVKCPECGTSIAPEWLKPPRQILRWWMAPLIAPVGVVGALWFTGSVTWTWARFHLRWTEPIITPVTLASFLIAAGWVYLIALAAYRDRPAGHRRLIAAGTGLVLAGIAGTSVFIIAVRLTA